MSLHPDYQKLKDEHDAANSGGAPSGLKAWFDRQSQGGKVLIVGGIIVAGIAFLGSIADDGTPAKTTSPTPPAASQPVAPAPAPKAAAPAPPPKPVKPAPATLEAELREQLGADRLRTVDTEGDTIAVVFVVGDNLTKNLRRIGAEKDVLDILDAAHRRHPGKHVTVRGDFPLVDKYGNEREGMVLLLNYSPATLAKINWSSDGKLLVRENIFELADASPKMVHHELVKTEK